MTDKVSEKPKEYVFTFLGDSELSNCYVTIFDTYTNARNRMVNIFGDRWAFQYDSTEKAGVHNFNLKHLFTL